MSDSAGWTRIAELESRLLDALRAQAKALNQRDDLRARAEAVVSTWPPGPRKGDVLRAIGGE